MQYLDIAWKIAAVLLPFILSWWKKKGEKSNRWQEILSIAEVVWKAIESYRTAEQKAKGYDGEVAFNNFIREVQAWLESRNVKNLSKEEYAALKQWATIRSQAGKYDERIANGANKGQ